MENSLKREDSSSKDLIINNPLSKKISKILETRLDNDKVLLDTLKNLSTIFNENNIRTRRSLRSNIEKRSVNMNEEFVVSFQIIKDMIDDIHKDIQTMNTCCNEMTSRLQITKEQTHELMNQTMTLHEENQRLQLHSEIIDVFLSKFKLSTEHLEILKMQDHSLHPDFFVALNRAKQIHTDCKLLLRTSHQTAGLEIMETMALILESAYEKLYRWIQNEYCLMTGDSPDISMKLCKTMEVLQERPVLFKYSLDEFTNARRAAIVRCFIDALTRGGPGGNPCPIELHSHDPPRYCADILAWAHQAIASEKEHCQALLKLCSKIKENEVGEELRQITEGLCRPLRTRMEQVIVSDPGPIFLYKLSNLIQFYKSTISQLIPISSMLLITLDELLNLCLRLFYSSLSATSNKLLDKMEHPSSGLHISSSIKKNLDLLNEILTSSDSSMLQPLEKKQSFNEILNRLIDPLLDACNISASQLPVIEMAIYLINCLHHIQTVILLFQFTDHKVASLEAQIEAHIDTLVNEQALFVLSNCGLANIMNIIQKHENDHIPLSKVDGMSPSTIQTVLKKFDNYLSRPELLFLPQSNYVYSIKLRELMKRRSMELIYLAYEKFYAALLLDKNNYQDIAKLGAITPDQVRQLLL